MDSPKTFVIVGLGLLGGSLGGALKRAFPRSRVIGVSRSSQKIRLAKKKKLITSGTTNLAKAVSSSNFIFICTPVDTISRLILQIDQFARKGTIVTDVGSTKEELIRWVEKRKFKHIRFVGSHPMAGSHLTGIEHATQNLYQSSFAFVTTHAGINKKALQLTVQIWKKLCDRAVVLDAKTHDQITAEISHLPHLVAALLVSNVSSKSLPFASTGFRDTTRVAQGDPRLWVPIFTSNRKNLNKLLGQLIASARQTRRFLQKPNHQRFLYQFLNQAAQKRRKTDLK